MLLFALSFAGCEVLLLAGMCRGRGGGGEWVVLCVLWLSIVFAVGSVAKVGVVYTIVFGSSWI